MVGRRCILYRQFARYRNRVSSKREEEEERRESDRIIAEMREKERSSGDDRRGSARIGENKRVDIARKREREAEKQLAFCTHVRSRDVGTRERGGNDDAAGERGGLTVACTCALPPYTMRSYGVFLRVRPPYDMCTRVHVYDRISSGETNSISGTIRVRLSVRPRVNL